MTPPPYRSDQIGSLIRPRYLLDAREAFDDWLKTNEKDRLQGADDARVRRRLEEAEQKAIAQVIAEQLNRGIFPLSSGEFEQHTFFGGFFEALDGFEVKFASWDHFRTGAYRHSNRSGVDPDSSIFSS